MHEETIAALASPVGRGALALVRLSGSKTVEILRRILPAAPDSLPPRHSTHALLQDDTRPICDCLFVYFQAPASYTGEDAAEISLYGNPLLVDEVLDLIYRSGARPALPGEFTFRAFCNGKIDLLQAEAINELIQANSRYYGHMEFANVEGLLSREVAALRSALIELGVSVETAIEFQEEQHLEPICWGKQIGQMVGRLSHILAQSRFSEACNRGLSVAIAGRVNVGKSSLFNALLLRERSIISPRPGTTSDYIQEKLNIDGLLLEINDLAGIHSASVDDVEREGIRRSRERIAQCDAALFVLDAAQEVSAADEEIYALLEKKPHLVLANKVDLADTAACARIRTAFAAETVHFISAQQQQNLEPIMLFFQGLVKSAPAPEAALALNQRQRSCLMRLAECLQRLGAETERSSCALELVAEEVRAALGIIGELTGQVHSEDILRQIFGTFCIGK